MKHFVILFTALLAATFSVAFSQTTQLNLMPIPANLAMGNGQFKLDKTFRVSVQGTPGERLAPAINRFIKRLAGRTGIFFENPTLIATTRSTPANLAIDCERPGKTVLGEDESYKLSVSSSQITLKAPTELGVMHGLETLLQLLGGNVSGYFFPAATITDTPRFAWRGLMMDVGRHFEPVEVIKRNLDGMAMMKMNTLHWHLSEDQGFRIESKTFPKLHQLGSDGLYYTQDEVRAILRYADLRGIRIVPEFDMPGHVTSWLVGYPELASGTPSDGTPSGKDSIYSIERKWGVMKPAMDPTKESTYQFLERFLAEMTALFPDAYFHIGGDENEGSQWRKNPKIQEFMRANQLADNHALQNHFNKRVIAILTKQGKKIMGWDEVFTPGVPKDIVIHSWRGKQSLIDAARQGYQVVLSNGYYVDLNYSAARHYLNDPVPANSPLDAAAQKRVLGGEAAMWGEYVDETTIDSRIWPRTAAIAERLWSPREVNNVDDMYRRLEIISVELEEVGLTHLKNADMLLRRMVQGVDIVPLKALVEVVEPVKEYARESMADYTSFSPLTRVVDAANPDSQKGREFSKAVETFLESRITQTVNADFKKKNANEPMVTDATYLETQLKTWQANHEKLKPLIGSSPVLQEIAGMSEDLSAIATIGLEALSFIQSGKPAPADWLAPRRKQLEEAKKPRGQAMLVIIEPITRLANWASVKK